MNEVFKKLLDVLATSGVKGWMGFLMLAVLAFAAYALHEFTTLVALLQGH